MANDALNGEELGDEVPKWPLYVAFGMIFGVAPMLPHDSQKELAWLVSTIYRRVGAGGLLAISQNPFREMLGGDGVTLVGRASGGRWPTLAAWIGARHWRGGHCGLLCDVADCFVVSGGATAAGGSCEHTGRATQQLQLGHGGWQRMWQTNEGGGAKRPTVLQKDL